MQRSTSGPCQTFQAPMSAMLTNQSSMTGPKTAPRLAVPRFWIAKSATRMPTVSGTTAGFMAGVTTMSPSMAPSTLMAGVMTPSP